MPASPSPAGTAPVTPRVLPLRPSRRRPVDREAALRQVRSVRHHLQSRQERFAHLKRVYD